MDYSWLLFYNLGSNPTYILYRVILINKKWIYNEG